MPSIRIWLIAAALLVSHSVYSARVYFTDQPATTGGSVISVMPDGTDQRTVTTVTGGNLRGIAFNRTTGRIYFLDNGTAKKVYSILPNGTGQQDVVPLGGTFNSDLEVDEAAGKVYWADSDNGFVMRASLNGTSVETAVTTPGSDEYTAPYFLFVDTAGSNVYWGVAGASGTSDFRRATLDGVIDPNFVITSPSRTRDIGIDPATETAYWCDRQTGSILKRALSGGVNQTVIGGMNAPHGIALDLEAEKIYWADTGGRGSGPFNTSARRVARCNFDGMEYETISTPTATSEAWDLALDLTSTNYNEWRPRFFSTSTPAAEPTDDADGDGAINLLEYAMGTHPRKSASVPTLTAEGTRMRYTRRRGANLSYRVEVSTDLAAWHYNFDGSGLVWTVQTSTTQLSPELETVTLRGGSALAGATRTFFRVRVATL